MPDRRRCAARWVALGVFLTCGTGMSRAKAAEPAAQALAAWEEGQRLVRQGRYRRALTEFDRGYRLSGKGGFLYNMAECARQVGDGPQAYRLYRRYLARHGGERHAQAVRALCSQLELGPCLDVGAVRLPAAPVGAPSEPGPATGRFDQPQSPQSPPSTQSPQFVGAARLELGAQVVPPEAEARRARPFYRRWPFWVGIGAAVLAGTVTAAVVAGTAGGSGGGAQPSGADFTLDFRGR
ncbi:MAG: hypothetical protein IT371_23515 [Deltaproteobacteria bacterium]|nr:hypothetical protein [Deltaproteobacteria bacterium]